MSDHQHLLFNSLSIRSGAQLLMKRARESPVYVCDNIKGKKGEREDWEKLRPGHQEHRFARVNTLSSTEAASSYANERRKKFIFSQDIRKPRRSWEYIGLKYACVCSSTKVNTANKTEIKTFIFRVFVYTERTDVSNSSYYYIQRKVCLLFRISYLSTFTYLVHRYNEFLS